MRVVGRNDEVGRKSSYEAEWQVTNEKKQEQATTEMPHWRMMRNDKCIKMVQVRQITPS